MCLKNGDVLKKVSSVRLGFCMHKKNSKKNNFSLDI